MEILNNYLGKRRGYLVALAVLIYLFSCIYFAQVLPYVHDYGEYLKQWNNLLSTGHPYLDPRGHFTGNAYGVLENALAILSKFDASAPRMFFVLLWFASSFLLLQLTENLKSKKKFFFTLAVTLLNPAFFIFFVVLGNNEIVISSLVLASVFLLDRKKNEVGSGVALAVGFLFKLTPFFLIPFLLVSKTRPRLKLLACAAVTMLGGLFVGYLLWGKEILVPFAFATGRDPTFMSIFYPIRHFTGLDVSFLSLPILVIALLITLIAQYKYKLDPVKISIVVLLEILLISRVNLPQYYIDLFFLLVYFVITRLSINGKEAKTIIVYLIAYSIIPIAYVFLDHFYGQWEVIRNTIAIPVFVATFCLLWIFLKDTVTAGLRKLL